MQEKQLSFVNPNQLHGCHPLDLNNHVNDRPSKQDVVTKKPLAVQKVETFSLLIAKRRHVLDHLLGRISGSDLPCKDQLAQYLIHKYRKNCSPKTLQIADVSLRQFLTFYRNEGKQNISQMTREDIEAFVENLQDRGLKPHSVRTRLCSVYAFIRFLIEEKILGYELMERKIKVKLPDRLPRVIDAEDLKLLLSVIADARDRALILLLLRTGMRIGELLNTKVNDVELNEQKILIYQAFKTGVGRVVYYSDDAQVALLAWLKARDPSKENLFYGKSHQSISYETARSMFKKYLKKAGLMHSGYTLHCLRHTFATDLLNARMPLECLRVLLGHTHLDVTRIYARLTDKTREYEYFNAMERILKGDPDADDQCDC